MKILFVCLGNICRSPLAAGILQQQVDQLDLKWQIASAGLANKYIDCAADPRVGMVAKRHGIDLSQHTARKFQVTDFDNYDMVITMDGELASRLRAKAETLRQADRVWLLADFLKDVENTIDIPDPYFWEAALFESLFHKMEAACQVIVETYNAPDILTVLEDVMMTNVLELERRA